MILAASSCPFAANGEVWILPVTTGLESSGRQDDFCISREEPDLWLEDNISSRKDNGLRDAELAVLEIEAEIATLVLRLSAAPPDAVAPDLMLFQRLTRFHLDTIRESLVALN